ncbi:phosphate regulon sensor histidine kinase PhoR [Pseudocolwellia sp. AS88]|jgi:two-component system phosphate regulon sensor histidine kinase PhoR|uniref:phosphate regulon sensor histidine kinase PhoR n=1 Tax=Pseudocolwellia TaxID=2848177 RepID=UPI0026EA8E91|nr:phosphate regulon sensor histidine kinase PhoR [Pseudocolwellia sp. AS88]MDO7086685.1 phosphate regulon sensor histidine kinase PhoR [Pseudocolwellia sp. AS88]
MNFKLIIRTLFFKLGTWLSLGILVGFLLDSVWAVLALCSLAVIAWHYRHLYEFINWIWQSKAISPPQAEGVWGEIYNGLYRQIKKQRKKQKNLNDKLRQFRDGAEALPDAALVLSKDFIIQWGNKKAQKLLGVRTSGDVGQRIDNLIRFPVFSKYLEAHNWETPCHIVSPVNHEVHLELRFMAYGTDHFLFIARDVSKIRRLEEMRRDFVANVSHELKTPLTVVRGYVEMIQMEEDAFNPYWKKTFSTIESQVSRMDRLVEQLLVLSRTEINIDNNAQNLVNVPELIEDLVEDSQWLNQESKHTITTDIDQSMGLLGFETELKSAFSNLLSNAIAYTNLNGNIHVTWKKHGNKMMYSVKDDGPGIGKQHITRLTERFYRIDKSRSRDTGGSGLGLAIVKHVLNHHHAELKVESELGKGSEFIIIFDVKNVVPLSK